MRCWFVGCYAVITDVFDCCFCDDCCVVAVDVVFHAFIAGTERWHTDHSQGQWRNMQNVRKRNYTRTQQEIKKSSGQLLSSHSDRYAQSTNDVHTSKPNRNI